MNFMVYWSTINQSRRGNHIEQFDNFMVPCSFSQKMLRIPQDDAYQVVMDPVVEGFEDPESLVVGSGTGSQVKDESEAYVRLRLAEEDGYRANYGSLVSKHEQDLSDIDEDSGNSTKPDVFSRIQFASHGAEQSVVQDTAINLNCRNKRRRRRRRRYEDTSTSLMTSSKRALPWVKNHKKHLGMFLRDSSSNPSVKTGESRTNKRLRNKNVDHRV